MASTPSANAAISNERAQELTFLGIPAELRLAIYEYAFNAEPWRTKFKLRPHALTRVNRQIRQECMPLYYASVETLEVPVSSVERISRARKWLEEVDLGAFSQKPNFIFISSPARTGLYMSIAKQEFRPKRGPHTNVARTSITETH